MTTYMYLLIVSELILQCTHYRISRLKKALFISPILDMEQLIVDMMSWANVSEKELSERKEIPTDFGETLSWEYLCFVRANPINWKTPTEIFVC